MTNNASQIGANSTTADVPSGTCSKRGKNPQPGLLCFHGMWQFSDVT